MHPDNKKAKATTHLPMMLMNKHAINYRKADRTKMSFHKNPRYDNTFLKNILERLNVYTLQHTKIKAYTF